MSKIIVREVAESDLPAIEKLTEELIDAMDHTEGIDINLVPENFRDLLKDPKSHLLVARAEDAVVGFISFKTRKTILHREPSGLIDALVVAGEYRGRGVGEELVSEALERCKQLGCCEVEVSTERANAEARKFYKRCGFEERGILFEVEL